MKIDDTQNSSLLHNLQTSLLSEALASLQVMKRPDEAKAHLNKYFPSLFAELNVYTGLEYRLKATRRIINIILK